MFIGFYVKYQLFLSDFNETWIYPQVFEKCANIKCRENPSIGIVVVHADGETGQPDTIEADIRFSKFCERA
jgi:hypothetical protein